MVNQTAQEQAINSGYARAELVEVGEFTTKEKELVAEAKVGAAEHEAMAALLVTLLNQRRLVFRNQN
jgi:hypothetical protein